MAKRSSHPLSHADARKRSLKGWETRRKSNPHLGNIHKVAEGKHEWRRPGGEVVPLHGFTDAQVESISPAFHASDQHLKMNQNLQLQIHALGGVREATLPKGAGALMHPTGEFNKHELKWLERKQAEIIYGVPKNSWGNTNVIHVSKRYIDHPQKGFAPAGIVTHEIGHAIGPGRLDKAPRVKKKEFQDSFQWKAPRKKMSGHQDFAETYRDPTAWKKTRQHPAKSKNYYGESIHEDFAETYRNLVGVPLEDRPRHTDRTTGRVRQKNSMFYWEDKNRKREDYMLKYHLESTASRGDLYSNSRKGK